MNALVTVEQAPTAGPHGEGHTLFSPRRQAEFLTSLQLFGNVRLAWRAARVWTAVPIMPLHPYII